MFGLCNLPNANYGLFISLVQFFGYFCPKNRSNEMNRPKIALAKYENCSKEINSPKNAQAKYFWKVLKNRSYEIRNPWGNICKGKNYKFWTLWNSFVLNFR